MDIDRLVAALTPLESCFVDDTFIFGVAIIPPEARMKPKKSVILLTKPQPETNGYHGWTINPDDVRNIFALIQPDMAGIAAADPDDNDLASMTLRFVLRDGRIAHKLIEGPMPRLVALWRSVESATANNPLPVVQEDTHAPLS